MTSGLNPCGGVWTSSLAIAMLEPERVVDLRLSLPFGHFPDEVLSLPNLESLTLCGTQIDSLPEALASMPKLAKVTLERNRFVRVPPVLGQMPALRELVLIEQNLPNLAGLGAIQQLRSLTLLLGNALQSVPGSLLGSELFLLTDLEELTLRNRFTDLPPELVRLTLQTLHVNLAARTMLPPWFSGFAALRTLWLDGTSISGAPAVLALLPALEALHLSSLSHSCLPASESLDALARTRLKSLSLYAAEDVRLPDEPGELVSTLTWLRLSKCKLGAVPPMVRRLRALEHLDLSDNDIDDQPKAFSSLHGLRELRLGGNRFTRLPDLTESHASLRALLLDANLESLDGAQLGAMGGLEALAVSGYSSTWKSPLKSLPNELTTLASLKSLKVQGLPALKKLPKDLSGLRSLETLDLKDCGITALPASLAKVTTLRTLVLSRTNLATLDDAVLAPLTQLRDIELDRCKLRALPPSLFTRPNLERLSLYDCHATKVRPVALPASVSSMTQLRTLQLGPEISELPDDLSALTKLRAFEWQGPAIERFPSSLCTVPSLQEISITGKLKSAPRLGALPESLGALTRLETLNLENSGVTHVPDSLGACTALSNVNLSKNPIVALPDVLGDLRELEWLNLANCELAEMPASLARCATLRELTLSGNKFDAAAMVALDRFAKVQPAAVFKMSPPSLRTLVKGKPLEPHILEHLRRLGVILPENAPYLAAPALFGLARWPAHDFESRPPSSEYRHVSFDPLSDADPDDERLARFHKVAQFNDCYYLLMKNGEGATDPSLQVYDFHDGVFYGTVRLSTLLGGLQIIESTRPPSPARPLEPVENALEQLIEGVERSSRATVERALTDGANPNAMFERRTRNLTPLAHALRGPCRSGTAGVVDALLDARANPNDPTVIDAILARMGEPTEDSHRSIAAVLARGAHIPPAHPDTTTAARHAAARSLELLIDHGLDVNALILKSRGRLHGVPEYSLLCEALWDAPYANVEILLRRGADVNYVTPAHGLTPLHFAVMAPDAKRLVPLLIERGARMQRSLPLPLHLFKHESPVLPAFEHGHTPRELATRYRLADIAALFPEE